MGCSIGAPHFGMKLRTNTSLTIIIAAAILLQLISAVQYYYTRSLLAEELEKRAESELTTKAVVVKNALNMSENTLRGHLWDLKRNLATPDSLGEVMAWVLRSHPNLTGCWVAFVPDYYPEKGRWFAPYVVRGNDGKLVQEFIGSASRDYPLEEWFVEALQSSEGYWSEPFFDQEDTTAPLIAYMLPVRDAEGRTVAIMGSDMSLDFLTDKLQALDDEFGSTKLPERLFGPSYAAHSFIIDHKGNFIAHYDHQRILKDNFLTQAQASKGTDDDAIVQAMIRGEEGYGTAVIEGWAAINNLQSVLLVQEE